MTALPSFEHLLPAPPAWGSDLHPRASATLCLFVLNAKDGPSILFTRRSTSLRSHAGQVGFPGGRREEADASPAETALRESWEEIGLDRGLVTIKGSIRPLKSLDGRPVITLVGVTTQSEESLIASPDEVAEIFTVPWRCFTPEHRSTIRFNIFGRWRETPYYEAQGHHVWGLTAWMIAEAGLH